MRAAVSLMTLAFFAPIATGCISNEYVIPRDELRRLAVTPPEQRGQQVHVIQDLGSRRMDAIPTDGPSWPQAEPWPQPYVEPPPPEEETRDTDVQLDLHGDIYIDGGYRHAPGGYSPPAGGAQAWRGSPPTGPGMTPAGGWQGKPPSGGGISGWRGAPPGSSGGGGSWRGVPSSGSGSSGGGLGNIGSGGGGGNGGEAMVVLAVVLAAIAVVMTVSLVSSEGVRFDGLAQMSPWQPVHLKQHGGGELVIALGDLSPVAIEGVVEAKVMDDEGYGIRTLRSPPARSALGADVQARRRLDDVRAQWHGALGLRLQHAVRVVRPTVAGAAAHRRRRRRGRRIRRDDHPHTSSASRRSRCPSRWARCSSAATSTSVPPPSPPPPRGSGPVEWGNAIGAGLLGELQVTSRMALTLRAGANEAFFANSGTTSPAATVTAGLALY